MREGETEKRSRASRKLLAPRIVRANLLIPENSTFLDGGGGGGEMCKEEILKCAWYELISVICFRYSFLLFPPEQLFTK